MRLIGKGPRTSGPYPLVARFTFTVDADTLTLTVDDDREVVDVTRTRGESSDPDDG